MPPPESKPYWPHAPVHKLEENGTYIVTTRTYQKLHHFNAPERRQLLEERLLKLALEYEWNIEAWAVFSNHYHFIGYTQNSAKNLRFFLGQLHEQTAKWVNRTDSAPGRKVWHNFRDTQLTYQRSYLARLNYVHHNPVWHGLVRQPAEYP